MQLHRGLPGGWKIKHTRVQFEGAPPLCIGVARGWKKVSSSPGSSCQDALPVYFPKIRQRQMTLKWLSRQEKVGETTLLLYKNKTKAQDWRLKIEGSRKVTPPQIFHNFNWTHYLKQKFRIEGSKKVSLTTNRGSKSTCLLTFSDQPLKSQQKKTNLFYVI